MGTGPEIKAGAGHDLALTELDDGFVLEAGHARRVRPPLPAAGERRQPRAVGGRRPGGCRQPHADRTTAADGRPARPAAGADGASALGRGRQPLPVLRQLHAGVPDVLLHQRRARDRPRRQRSRQRARLGLVLLHPASPRSPAATSAPQPKHRYRQWLTHKFASWWDQFGSSGCTGCGRCITFCPVGIDVREELRRHRAGAAAARRAEVRAHRRRPPGLRDGADRRQAGGDARHDDLAARRSRRRAHRRRPGPVRDGRAAQSPGRGDLGVALPASPTGSCSPSAPPVPRPRRSSSCRSERRSASAARCGIGWPHEPAYGKDVVVVTGGTGLAPLRPLLDRFLAERRSFGAIRLLYGARTAGRHAVHRGARALGQGRRVRSDLPLAVAPPGRRRRRCRPLDGERDPPRVLGRHRTRSPTSAAPSG